MILKGIQKSSFIDYPGKVSTVLFTAGCNFRCPYCHNGHLVRNEGEVITEKEVFSLLTKRKGIIDAVVISGGEPTLYGEELINFIEEIKKLNYLVKLDTNGTSPLVVEKLIKRGLIDYIAMDIKAPLSEYSKAVKTKIEVASIQESISLIKDSNIPYEFRTTVAKELLTKEDILRIIEEISPCEKYYLQNFKDGENILEGKGKFSPVDFLEELSSEFSFVEVR